MRAIFNHFQKPVSIAPLAMFRIVFGVMVFYSTLRFMLKGWVHDLYVNPKFYFTYFGFDWVRPLTENGMYTIFVLMLLTSIGIILGLYYRLNTTLFFILFTYVELLDKTNYLNHYYFVSLVSFLLTIVPAASYFSLDVYFKKISVVKEVPKWTIDIFKFQVGIVYLCAGIAKLNYHWLIEAQPLVNWLKHQTDLPIIGTLFKYKITAFAFAWGGALYDLCIPFILLSKKWRVYGFGLVVLFHFLTAIMFPIGIFPYVMIGSALIFFSSNFHQKCINYTLKILGRKIIRNNIKTRYWQAYRPIKFIVVIFIAVQVLLPFRYIIYPGKLFWTEQGYRFSWRVMLIEKVGYAQFTIKDEKINGELVVNNFDHLTPQQEKMMATQPDMILQYAHYLRDVYKDSNWNENGTAIKLSNPIVTVNSEVVLFNEGSRTFIDPSANLADAKRGWHHKTWILEYE